MEKRFEKMSFKIIYEHHEDFLLIKYSGYKDIYEFFSSLNKANEICKEKNYHKIILDTFDVNFLEIRVTDKFSAGEKLAEVFGYPNKIAVLAPKKFHDNFTEIVTANRGGLIKTFDNKNDAIEWLS